MSFNQVLTKAIKKTKNNNNFWLMLDKAGVEDPAFGGCLICAKAIMAATGRGELIRIESNFHMHQQTEHYGAIIDDVIYDFNGCFTSSHQWVKFLEEMALLKGRQLSISKGHDPYSDIVDDDNATQDIAGLIKQSLSKVF